MERKAFLQRTIPTWINLPIKEILIVDWGMKENLSDLLKIDDRISIIQVPDQQYFDAGAAINTGVRHVTTEYVFHVDSDIMIQNSLCLANIFNQKFDYTRIRNPQSTSDGFFRMPMESYNGTCLFKKQVWETVGGYIETLKGWGWEDNDFYNLIKQKNFQISFLLNLGDFQHIDHSPRLRYKNFPLKGRTWRVNQIRTQSGRLPRNTEYKVNILRGKNG
jgi:predicted glycosyltransferase involved in capsule biosynthesis